MEEFRKKYEKRFRFTSIMCCILPAAFFAARHFSQNTSEFAQGLVYGLFVALMVAAIAACTSMGVTLRNEEYLKKKYIEENDERNAEIAKKTMHTSSLISLYLTAIAVIVSGFFNEIVSITLCIDVLVGAIITVAVKTYYKKKM